MRFITIIPVANVASANLALEKMGYGADNFQVEVARESSGGEATHRLNSFFAPDETAPQFRQLAGAFGATLLEFSGDFDFDAELARLGFYRRA